MNKIVIMMRIGFDGEALNNESNIGNVTQPRLVSLSDGTIRNAISGDMLKHNFTRNLRVLANDNEICNPCKFYSPMKNAEVIITDNSLSLNGNKSKQCIIDDVCGFMNASGDKSKRTSCVKFSYAISVDDNEYEIHTHNRVDATENGTKQKSKNKTKDSKVNTELSDIDDCIVNDNLEEKDETNQMIFYKPIRSNVYAITIQLDMDRISFDDEKLKYISPDEVINKRKTKCLQALRNMFIDMEGAMCSTRLPHLRNIEGVAVLKNNKDEVLVKYSALNDDFIKVNKNISTNSIVFNNVEEFVNVLERLMI